MLDQLLEVALGRLEGLLEGRVDLAVGLADQALELGERRLEVRRAAPRALDVRERLLVLALGERVDRAELLAPAREALELAPRSRARSSSPSASLGGAELAPERRGDPLELGGGLGAAVAEVGDADLGLGDRLAGGAQLRLQLGLLARARAQLAR